MVSPALTWSSGGRTPGCGPSSSQHPTYTQSSGATFWPFLKPSNCGYPISMLNALCAVTSCSTLRGLRRRCPSPPSSRTSSPARRRTRTSSSCPRREPATSRMSSGSRPSVLRPMSRYKQPHRGTSNVKECCSLQFGIRKTPNHHQQGQKDLLDTEFLNFRYCLNVTIFKYLSINYLNLGYWSPTKSLIY